LEQIPPGAQEYPTAAWMQHHFNQTMDWTNRRLVAQSFVFPGVGAMENTPLPLRMSVTEIPVMPAEINMGVRRFWFVAIGQFVSNWELISKAIRQWIGWVIEQL